MALVRCRVCGFEAAVGCMPTASCGLLLIPGIGIGGTVAFALVRRLMAGVSVWLGLPSAILAGVIGSVLGVLVFLAVAGGLEWILAMCHRCPECQSRSWSFPFTRGFGL